MDSNYNPDENSEKLLRKTYSFARLALELLYCLKDSINALDSLMMANMDS